MKIAITGGTGFVGRNLARTRVAAGHPWQTYNTKFVPAWVCSGLIHQVGNTIGDRAYQHDPPGSPTSNWGDFNIEQQGAIVDQWFAGQRSGRKTPMDPDNPYLDLLVTVSEQAAPEDSKKNDMRGRQTTRLSDTTDLWTD